MVVRRFQKVTTHHLCNLICAYWSGILASGVGTVKYYTVSMYRLGNVAHTITTVSLHEFVQVTFY